MPIIEVVCIDGTDPRMVAIIINGVYAFTIHKDVYDVLVGPLGLPLWPCGE